MGNAQVQERPTAKQDADWNKKQAATQATLNKKNEDEARKQPEPAKVLAVTGRPIPEFISAYPFNALEFKQGFFVADEDIKSTVGASLSGNVASNVDWFNKEVQRANAFYSASMHDAYGPILEDVTITGPKTHNNRPELDGDGRPVLATSTVKLPVALHFRYFSVRHLVEGDDLGNDNPAPTAGVLVVREI